MYMRTNMSLMHTHTHTHMDTHQHAQTVDIELLYPIHGSHVTDSTTDTHLLANYSTIHYTISRATEIYNRPIDEYKKHTRNRSLLLVVFFVVILGSTLTHKLSTHGTMFLSPVVVVVAAVLAAMFYYYDAYSGESNSVWKLCDDN